MGTRPDLEVIR